MTYEPFDILELEYGVSPEEIKTQFKKLCKVHHPDHSDEDDTKFIKIKEAYEKAIVISRNLKCSECNGQGKTLEAVGFSFLKVGCKACQGTGKKHK